MVEGTLFSQLTKSMAYVGLYKRWQLVIIASNRTALGG